MQKSDVTLSCKNLWKVFGDQALEAFLPLSQSDTADKAQKIAAVSDAGGIVACGDVNLEIKRGEFFVLMGLSGSGKSTLMRCMSRLTEPTSGQLLLDDQDFLSASNKQLRDIRRSKMGMVFQHFGLFPHMTVLQNVAYPLRVKKIKQSEREKQALHMIKLVGLEGRESAYPHQLSGGQKQRVGIARSLSVDPELWFLDEPFSALDPLIRWQMQSE
jgi:glycine betaine/proline transport system ATP-binding protein